MPIIKKKGAAIKGGDTPALSRRVGQKSGPYSAPQTKKNVVTGEVGEIVKLWNNQAPGTIRRLTETVAFQRVSTGILTLDLCLVGGLMRSRAAMLYGERSAGKSTLMARYMATALSQNPDGVAALVDIEGTADKSWMARQGVDIERVIIVEPSTGEDAVDQVDALVRAQEITFLGIDSIAMITPFKEIDSSAEDQQIGLQARLIGKMLRRMNNAILQERRRDHHPLVCMLNQFRMKAGFVMGDPRTLPGGKALEFVTSQQVEVRNKEHKNEKTQIVDYNEHTIVVTKDKTGGRYKEGKFKLIRDEDTMELPVGYIDQSGSIIEFGERAGLVTGRYEIDGVKTRLRNKDEVKRYFLEHPAQEAAICAKIIEYYRKRWDIDI